MANLRRFVAQSPHPAARLARRLYHSVRTFTLPAPKIVVKPALWLVLALRTVYHFVRRTMFAEPLFKAYCKEYGRRVRTDIYLHWIQGKGDIILGDDVLIDGLCAISFASRFCARPTLRIGSGTGVGHGCSFAIGKAIVIGEHCRIAANVRFFDSSGHPADPAARLNGAPPAAEDVRPITVGDNVWIGMNSIVFPGVTLGEGCIVSAGSVVLGDVPAWTVVAGNPARKIMALTPPGRKELQAASS
jgi:acetyltransferase-like isoleucine patch superfamily enzyme